MISRRGFLRAAIIGGGIIACPEWLEKSITKSYFFFNSPHQRLHQRFVDQLSGLYSIGEFYPHKGHTSNKLLRVKRCLEQRLALDTKALSIAKADMDAHIAEIYRYHYGHRSVQRIA